MEDQFGFLLLNNDRFMDIYFTDSLTGWKCIGDENDSSMKKTTDGGFYMDTATITKRTE